jgi:phosphoribosyl-AMP cyclohydrolase
METVTIQSLRFDAHGLIPAIVQDAETDQVLMLAYMNIESLQLTLETKETHFWSRVARSYGTKVRRPGIFKGCRAAWL